MEYMLSGPVVCMAWEGKDVVRMGRKMLGATNPLESDPGTIRGDFGLEVSIPEDVVIQVLPTVLSEGLVGFCAGVGRGVDVRRVHYGP